MLTVHEPYKVFIFEEFCSGGTLEELLREGPIADDILIQVYTLQVSSLVNIFAFSPDTLRRCSKGWRTSTGSQL
jgi:hypothetical protein